MIKFGFSDRFGICEVNLGEITPNLSQNLSQILANLNKFGTNLAFKAIFDDTHSATQSLNTTSLQPHTLLCSTTPLNHATLQTTEKHTTTLQTTNSYHTMPHKKGSFWQSCSNTTPQTAEKHATAPQAAKSQTATLRFSQPTATAQKSAQNHTATLYSAQPQLHATPHYTQPRHTATPCDTPNFGKFDKFNLAFHVGDDFRNAWQNRIKFAQILGVELGNLIFMNQIHGDQICVIDSEFLGKFRAGIDKFVDKFNKFSALDSQNQANLKKINDEFLGIFPVCDAMITDLGGVGLCVMVADCSPVILIDEKNGAVGVAHAGRNGVIKKIATKTAMKMSEIYGSKFSDLAVFVGTNIKGSCYEVGDLDLGEFERFKNGNKFDMDLALRNEFNELGINKFAFSNVCSHCDQNHFSYRRDKDTGRFCGFVLKEKNG